MYIYVIFSITFTWKMVYNYIILSINIMQWDFIPPQWFLYSILQSLFWMIFEMWYKKDTISGARWFIIHNSNYIAQFKLHRIGLYISFQCSITFTFYTDGSLWYSTGPTNWCIPVTSVFFGRVGLVGVLRMPFKCLHNGNSYTGKTTP